MTRKLACCCPAERRIDADWRVGGARSADGPGWARYAQYVTGESLQPKHGVPWSITTPVAASAITVPAGVSDAVWYCCRRVRPYRTVEAVTPPDASVQLPGVAPTVAAWPQNHANMTVAVATLCG